MLCDQRLRLSILFSHLFKLGQALLELLSGGWVLSNGSNQLDVVESGLLIEIIQQLNDQVQLVKVVNLNFTLF